MPDLMKRWPLRLLLFNEEEWMEEFEDESSVFVAGTKFLGIEITIPLIDRV